MGASIGAVPSLQLARSRLMEIAGQMKYTRAFRMICLVAASCASASAQINGSGNVNAVPKFSDPSTLTNSAISDINGLIGVGNVNPGFALDVTGDINQSGTSYRIGGTPVIQVVPSAYSFFFAGAGNSTVSGTGNFGAGPGGLSALTSGTYNVGVGQNALNANTTGSLNVAVGDFSLNRNVSGNGNAVCGVGALQFNISGNQNTANGVFALSESTGSGNSALGAGALQTLGSGDANDAFGGNSLTGLVSGTDNVAVGDGAGDDVPSGYMTNATRNIYLGASSQSQQDNDSNEVVIGAYAHGNGSNTVTLGNTSIATTYLQGNIVLPGSVTFPDATVQSTAWNGILKGGDYAESVEVIGEHDSYQPGDVIAIDVKRSGHFTLAATSYSRLVAGVYSTKPGLTGRRQPENQSKQDEIPMAMIGIVPVKATTANGSIQIGDLLVSSSRAGYAMKGDDAKITPGSVIGKALAALASGEGLVEVLLTIQ